MTPERASVAVRIVRLGEVSVGQLAGILPSTEREEANRFRLEKDRLRFLIGRGLLRNMLAERMGHAPEQLDLRRDALGKPCSRDAPDLAFNLSHSGDLVAVAVGAVRAIGIDVEEMRHDLDLLSLARHIYTPSEIDMLAGATPDGRPDVFFRSWVCKEALVKGVGTGLSCDPKRFEVVFEGSAPMIRRFGGGGGDIDPAWSLELLPVPAGYAGALAILD